MRRAGAGTPTGRRPPRTSGGSHGLAESEVIRYVGAVAGHLLQGGSGMARRRARRLPGRSTSSVARPPSTSAPRPRRLAVECPAARRGRRHRRGVRIAVDSTKRAARTAASPGWTLDRQRQAGEPGNRAAWQREQKAERSLASTRPLDAMAISGVASSRAVGGWSAGKVRTTPSDGVPRVDGDEAPSPGRGKRRVARTPGSARTRRAGAWCARDDSTPPPAHEGGKPASSAAAGRLHVAGRTGPGVVGLPDGGAGMVTTVTPAEPCCPSFSRHHSKSSVDTFRPGASEPRRRTLAQRGRRGRDEHSYVGCDTGRLDLLGNTFSPPV